LAIRYREIVECIGWICPVTPHWADCTSSFVRSLASQSAGTLKYLKSNGTLRDS
jgi:hypothetical protein